MKPGEMTNEQLAWELEKPCGGREKGIEFDLLQEAARRLRADTEAASKAQPRVATIDEARPTVENMERAMGQVEKEMQDG